MANKKTCYIISQIGKPDSKEREWANFVREHIITPAVTDCGYEVPARADDPQKDLIMTDIIEQMFLSDLVVADLTDNNPNVYYELGIRHCAQKPAIHLIRNTESPPFDLGGNKAMFISTEHVDVIKAIKDIQERIKAIEKNPKQFFSQVQMYIQHKNLEVFKQTQAGKDDLLVNGMYQLTESFQTLSEMQKQIYYEVVEKPQQRRSTFLSDWHSPTGSIAQQYTPAQTVSVHDSNVQELVNKAMEEFFKHKGEPK